jgi:hypothetical protein
MRNRMIRSLLIAVGMVFLSGAAFAQVRLSIRIAPPMLPVYEQPICPGDGYIWTPGYWAYGDDYYWVPGEWVMAPEPGYLWTPGYWGWGDDGYFFNDGYWGDEVGFYGGINYGFGYFGHGYEGGRWQDGHFFYNTTMNNVSARDNHNVYTARVSEGAGSHVSYNGGTGGVSAHATSQEEAAAHGNHSPAVASQNEHAAAARNDPQARLSANHGTPSGTTGGGAVAGNAGAASRPEASVRPTTAVHPKELPAVERPAAPNTGNAKLDQKYQKQQDKLVATQTKDRQQLQQKQDSEHQQLARQKATPEKTQQVEQQHAQQTQQLQQTHTQQTQQMQQRQAPPAGGAHGGGRGH